MIGITPAQVRAGWLIPEPPFAKKLALSRRPTGAFTDNAALPGKPSGGSGWTAPPTGPRGYFVDGAAGGHRSGRPRVWAGAAGPGIGGRGAPPAFCWAPGGTTGTGFFGPPRSMRSSNPFCAEPSGRSSKFLLLAPRVSIGAISLFMLSDDIHGFPR